MHYTAAKFFSLCDNRKIIFKIKTFPPYFKKIGKAFSGNKVSSLQFRDILLKNLSKRTVLKMTSMYNKNFSKILPCYKIRLCVFDAAFGKHKKATIFVLTRLISSIFGTVVKIKTLSPD